MTTKAKLSVRERIVRAAAQLLKAGGLEAVSTRAVSAAADVQPPAIYRQFGDMEGLLEAVARETLAAYVQQKARREPSADPFDDLRRGWEEHIAFGLANPDAYAILYTRVRDAPAAREGMAILEALLGRVAETGRLRMSVEPAARLMHAGGKGVVLSLIATPAAARDAELSESMYQALLAAMTDAPTKTARTSKRVAPRAIALRAVLPEARAISAGERHLLGEWLDRLAEGLE